MTRAQRLAAAGLLVLAVGVFSAARVAKSSLALWDFNIYAAAANAWVEGRNPYDESELQTRWNVATGKMDLGAQRSIAPPTTLVLVAPLAMLPLRMAFLVWTLMSVGLIVTAVIALWRMCGWRWREPRALVLLACVIGSGPFILGISVGQPSIPAAACIVLGAACSTLGQEKRAGVLLALATALKLQLGAPVIAYFLLRGRWRTATVAIASFALIGTIALVRLQAVGVVWVDDWIANFRDSATAGGRNDFVLENKTRDHLLNVQLPFYAMTGSRSAANGLAWAVTGFLIAAYVPRCWRRRGDDTRLDELLHVGFIATVMLLPLYHRYYDGIVLMVVLSWALRRMDWSLLLLLTPFLLPVGWAMNLVKREIVPASVGATRWWNALVMTEQSWVLLGLAIVLLRAIWRHDEERFTDAAGTRAMPEQPR